MISSARNPQSAMLAERLLITRIITSLGLTLLFMLGIAGAGHGESEGAPPVSLAMTALVDPHVDLLSHGPAAASHGAEHEVFSSGLQESSALMGAALCMLGMLCGLVFAVLIRGLWRGRTPPDRGSLLPRVLSLLPASVARPRATVLSLTQLGLSRT